MRHRWRISGSSGFRGGLLPFRGFEEISDRLLRDIELVEIKIPGGTMTRDRKQFSPIQEAYYQASQYLKQGDLPSALKAFKRVIDLRPEPPFLSAIYTMMGMVHARVRNQGAAIKAFREAIRLNEKAVFAHLFLGTSLMTSKRFQEAIGPIQRARELDPSLTHVLFYLAYVYSELGRLDDAIAAYNAEIATHGQSPEAYKELAKLYVRLGDEDSAEGEQYYLKAIDTYRAWASAAPQNSETDDFISYLYSKLRAVNPAAIEAYEKAAPNNVLALFNLGTAYLATDRNQEAKAVFEQLTELGESGMREKLARISANLDVVRSSTGEAYQKLGAASLKIYQAHTEAESRDRSLLIEAEKAFKTALEYVPVDIHSLYCLGITYWMMGCRVAAINEFRAVLEIDPNNEDAANNLRFVEEELGKVRHWLGSKVWKRMESSTDQTPIFSEDLLDEIAEARTKIYENVETLHESDAFASDDLLQALLPLMESIPSAEAVADLAMRIFQRGWLTSAQAARLAGTELASFLAHLHLMGVSLEDLAEGGDRSQEHNEATIQALKEVLESNPNDERAGDQLQTLLQKRLDEKLLESGLLKEVKGPITDFTPYKDRALMPVGNKPLSELVIEGRR